MSTRASATEHGGCPEPVRSGGYAELDGVVYACTPRLPGPLIELVVHGPEAPAGFELRRDRMSWVHVMPRADLSRLFQVRTYATWLGHEVRVEAVRGEQASLWSQTYREPDDPRVVLDRGSWSAVVPVDELRDVVSVTTELPLP